MPELMPDKLKLFKHVDVYSDTFDFVSILRISFPSDGFKHRVHVLSIDWGAGFSTPILTPYEVENFRQQFDRIEKIHFF